MDGGEGHDGTVTGRLTQQDRPRRWRPWRRRRSQHIGPVRRAVGVVGAVLCVLSFLMFVAAGIWWLGSWVWDAVPDGAGVLAGVAFGCCLIGGTLASVGGETDG